MYMIKHKDEWGPGVRGQGMRGGGGGGGGGSS